MALGPRRTSRCNPKDFGPNLRPACEPRKTIRAKRREGDREMAKLTAATRNALPNSDFAGPDRSYPIENPSHARNALSRAAQNASPQQQKAIQAKVKRRYPNIHVGGSLQDLARG